MLIARLMKNCSLPRFSAFAPMGKSRTALEPSSASLLQKGRAKSMASVVGCLLAAFGHASEDVSIVINLERGQLADYGATPWYTEDLAVGTSPMRFALDTGTNLLWATSDQCNTTACDAHKKVNTTQPGFSWVQ